MVQQEGVGTPGGDRTPLIYRAGQRWTAPIGGSAGEQNITSERRMSQFAFLQREWPAECEACGRAESSLHADARTA
jgi:hypothetical protein